MKAQDLGLSCIQKYQPINCEKNDKDFYKTLYKAHKRKKDIKRNKIIKKAFN